MNLKELKDERKAVPMTPHKQAVQQLGGYGRFNGGHVVVIEQDGMVQYQRLYPDGHLGSVED